MSSFGGTLKQGVDPSENPRSNPPPLEGGVGLREKSKVQPPPLGGGGWTSREVQGPRGGCPGTRGGGLESEVSISAAPTPSTHSVHRSLIRPIGPPPATVHLGHGAYQHAARSHLPGVAECARLAQPKTMPMARTLQAWRRGTAPHCTHLAARTTLAAVAADVTRTARPTAASAAVRATATAPSM